MKKLIICLGLVVCALGCAGQSDKAPHFTVTKDKLILQDTCEVEILDSKGNYLIKERNISIDISSLKKGKYYVNFDCDAMPVFSTATFIKKSRKKHKNK